MFSADVVDDFEDFANIVQVLIAFCAEFMVTAIDEVSKDVSPEFIGLILLPIVGNAAEHATAVTV